MGTVDRKLPNLRHLSQERELHFLALCGQTLEQRFVWPLGVNDSGLVALQEERRPLSLG